MTNVVKKLANLAPVSAPDMRTNLDIIAEVEEFLGHRLERVMNSWYTEHGFDAEVLGFKVKSCTKAQRDYIQKIAENANRPLPDAEILKQIAKVVTATASRRQGIDLQAWTQIMLEELGQWPAFVVEYTLKAWRENNQFLPTQADLHKPCKKRSELRRALLNITVEDLRE